MWRTRGTFLAALLVCAGALAACGTGGAPESSFADRLELIPASVVGERQHVILAMADLDRAAELAGVTRPADTSSPDAAMEYGKAITGVGDLDAKEAPTVAALTPEAASDRYVLQLKEFEKEVGWSLLDIAWFVEFRDPPKALLVAGGEFDEKRLTAAMGQPDDGIWRLGDKDGAFDPEAVSPARPLGQSLRLALSDGQLLVGRTTPSVRAAVDGDGETLADNDVVRALAQAMDAEGAYSAYFNASGVHKLDPVHSVIGGRKAGPDQVLPEPFRGVAGGLTKEDGKAVAVLAYAHASDSAAEANAAALRTLVENGRTLSENRPWSDTFAVDDIRTDGSTLVARLALDERANPQSVYGLTNDREGLVSHR
jgi:hypothetical protein